MSHVHMGPMHQSTPPQTFATPQRAAPRYSPPQDLPPPPVKTGLQGPGLICHISYSLGCQPPTAAPCLQPLAFCIGLPKCQLVSMRTARYRIKRPRICGAGCKTLGTDQQPAPSPLPAVCGASSWCDVPCLTANPHPQPPVRLHLYEGKTLHASQSGQRQCPYSLHAHWLEGHVRELT